MAGSRNTIVALVALVLGGCLVAAGIALVVSVPWPAIPLLGVGAVYLAIGVRGLFTILRPVAMP